MLRYSKLLLCKGQVGVHMIDNILQKFEGTPDIQQRSESGNNYTDVDQRNEKKKKLYACV